MALPFSVEQCETIRRQLFKSACKYAVSPGLKKTSLEMLTSDAGISKSTFYKFYESKELLFGAVGQHFETLIIQEALKKLADSSVQSDLERAESTVMTAFETIREMNIGRFLLEDLPLLTAYAAAGTAKKHFISSAHCVFEALKQADIRFSAPDEVVETCITLLYLSMLSIGDVGENYFIALRTLVRGACGQLIA